MLTRFAGLDFIVRAEGPVGAALATPLTTEVISEPIVMGNRAIVEMRSRDAGGVNLPRGKNGMPYDNRYAWLVKFDVSTGLIIEVSRGFPFLPPLGSVLTQGT